MKDGTQMPKDGERWVQQHQDELATPAKRQQMLDRLRKQSKQPKIAPESPFKKRQRLTAEFIFRYEQLKGMGASEQMLIRLCRYYRKQGVSYNAITKATGMYAYELKKRGI
ncbi:hypothetical protein FC35_GL000502 [Limosilactobacillus coleohominis DSM 14060]|nr:hypothetical protein FC35_GL000502 [Limosilactobacillus coleohominis DSM 14060]